MIYHLTTEEEWSRQADTDVYFPARFNDEGFIHASTNLQLERTANRIFSGVKKLYLLHINDEIEKAFIRYENLEGGTELFPHIYRKLPKSSIAKIQILNTNTDGRFTITL